MKMPNIAEVARNFSSVMERLKGTPGNRVRRSSGGVPPPSAKGAQGVMSLWDIGAETAPLLSRASTFLHR